MVRILWFVLGTIFGSTSSALIHRLPKNISWATGRSECPKCHHPLAWYDLIPLLSYLFLLGKCRYCHKSIPITYLLLEIAVGLGFAYFTSWDLAALWWITVTIAVMDWRTQLVSDWFVGIWIILLVVAGNVSLLGALVGIVVIGGLWAGTRGRGMGSGDIGIAAAMGLWLGWPQVWLGLLLAFVIGAIYGLILMVLKKVRLSSRLAFGPFLILSTWLVYFWGDRIWLLLYG